MLSFQQTHRAVGNFADKYTKMAIAGKAEQKPRERNESIRRRLEGLIEGVDIERECVCVCVLCVCVCVYVCACGCVCVYVCVCVAAIC